MPERRLAWFHCFSGIAGDMALGALIDAGADVDEVRALCRRLPVDGWAIETEPVLRGGLAGTKVRVRTAENSVVHRTAAHIIGLVEEARLPTRVADRALGTFRALAEAEGRLHRRPPSQVHFHEVGGIDAIVDVVGTCAALEVLDVDEVYCSPVANGIGMVRSAHGLIPNPPPAVVELLRGVPTYGLDLAAELTTPTGAALVAALATGFGPMPPCTVEATGFGAGDREFRDRPNLVQVVLGARVEELVAGQPIVLLEVTVDDVTGEVLAATVEAALADGAADVWVAPVTMKKGRPGHVVSALVDPSLAAQVAAVLVRETGSLGVRAHRLERWPQSRRFDEVEVEGHPVRVKVGPGRVKVEHDDAARVARRLGLPLREILSRAEGAYRERSGGPASAHRLDHGPGQERGGEHRHGPGDDEGPDGRFLHPVPDDPA
jgi:pyridinium-3,5-bisthiocarboxylic acid mononucleotide nickel chelatase